MGSDIPTITMDELRVFHAKHFPHGSEPKEFLLDASFEAEESCWEEEDALGYYSDGMKRTLTDEQIAIFRHSEIHTILRERGLRREDGDILDNTDAGEETQHISRNITSSEHMTDGVNDSAALKTSQDSWTKSLGTIRSGRVEKLTSQQWATSSPRTKAKNKKNRNKYKARKKDAMQREQVQSHVGQDHEDDESDEWDPWHQANGPDVQQETTVDLDY